MKKSLLIIVYLIFTGCDMNTSSLQPSPMHTIALRLSPGQDLKVELQKFIDENKLEAACVLTCVGSLQKSTLRLANQSAYQQYDQKMEIVSLVGVMSVEGSHLHISLSDSTGTTVGGHLVDGCIVYTTAEIILGIMPSFRFAREHDSTSGYKELKIYQKPNG
jgi:predicted DNA-binding protein with PD1-like motif